jgi:A nuclease family of the HNH/ENDO VII superfamily with conserved AHH
MSILIDHHIIPQWLARHRAFNEIDRTAFDIDSPANRIYLPADRGIRSYPHIPAGTFLGMGRRQRSA